MTTKAEARAANAQTAADVTLAETETKNAIAALDTVGRALALVMTDLQSAKGHIVQTDEAIAGIPDPAPLPPVRKTVKDWGARGDGKTDDTAAFQAAADAGDVYAKDDGSVYLINAVRSVLFRKDKSTVQLAPSVTLKAIPNSAGRYYIFDVDASDCVIDCGGALFLGDRDQHTYAPGSTHEHGYCVFVGGNRNKLRHVRPEKATGDGVGVSGDDHEIGPGVICNWNRRQGLSAFRSKNLWIHDSEFSNTGNPSGTDPAGLIGPFCGIDVEPDAGSATGIRIERVIAANNQRSGIIFWVRSEVAGTLEATLTECKISGSSNAIWAKDEAVRATTITLKLFRNELQWTTGAGAKIDQGASAVIGDSTQANENTFIQKDGSRPDLLHKTGKVTNYDIQNPAGGKVAIGVNSYK